MNDLQHFAIVGNRAEFRPAGNASFPAVVRLIADALAAARALNIAQLLVNTTALTGLTPPSLGDRYFAIRQWSAAAGGRVTLALVVQYEMIDPQKFGVVVASNAGLHAQIFSTESPALAWLQEQRQHTVGVRDLREPAGGN